jgi:hypothetical protein
MPACELTRASVFALAFGVGLDEHSRAVLAAWVDKNPNADEQAVAAEAQELRDQELRRQYPSVTQELIESVRAHTSGVSYDYDGPSVSPPAAPVARARESKRPTGAKRSSGGATRRARSPDDDPSGSSRGGDEPPPSPDLTHAARAVLRCGARLARRQRHRFSHHRRTATA